MYDAVEKAEVINGILNAAGKSGKKIIRISNIGDIFGRAKQVLIEVQTSLATCLIKAIKIKIRGGEAQSLMTHTAIEENTDWVLLSDAYIKPQTAARFQHGKGKADIHITNTNLQLEETDEVNGNFVLAEVAGIPRTAVTLALKLSLGSYLLWKNI
uniref:Uncharacterized protein n=1 Tax=Glossina palpalis gambiensis TaxID=67801 RepID=A0A1B0B1T4_9MUSC